MKIAVPFANGEVFQHFGHTENFKLYEIEAGQIVSSEIIGTNGSGHEALANFLTNLSVNILVCGGIGDGAQAALTDAGIEICSGAQGDADEWSYIWDYVEYSGDHSDSQSSIHSESGNEGQSQEIYKGYAQDFDKYSDEVA